MPRYFSQYLTVFKKNVILSNSSRKLCEIRSLNHSDLVDGFKVKLETFWDLAVTNPSLTFTL